MLAVENMEHEVDVTPFFETMELRRAFAARLAVEAAELAEGREPFALSFADAEELTGIVNGRALVEFIESRLSVDDAKLDDGGCSVL